MQPGRLPVLRRGMVSRRQAVVNICWCASLPPHAVMTACTLGRPPVQLLPLAKDDGEIPPGLADGFPRLVERVPRDGECAVDRVGVGSGPAEPGMCVGDRPFGDPDPLEATVPENIR